MKVKEKGGATVSLTKNRFVAKGGEGSVYAIGTTGYKIYEKPANAIPYGKIQDLGEIDDPRIIKPLTPVLSTSGQHVGHTFRFVKDTRVLVSLFPKAFRNRHGLTPAMVLGLVKQLQTGIGNLHKADILGVDLNEMNFLVEDDFSELYFIDVDSYKTPNYPATAIMASIRDWQCEPINFSEETDWFSFAILAFQLFVGIHPYKGMHPSLNGFEDRVKANMSVFSPEVKIPKSCIPFDAIPKLYRGWFEAVLQNGDRSAPPTGLAKAVALIAPVRLIHDSKAINILTLVTMTKPVQRTSWSMGNLCVLSANSGKFKTPQREQEFRHSFPAGTEIFWTPRNNTPLFAYIKDGNVTICTQDGKPINFVGAAEKIKASDGRLYCKFDDTVTEVQIHEAGSNILGSNINVASVMPNASKLFEGGVIQSVLGSMYVNLFSGPGFSHQVRIPELDKVKTLELKYQNRVLMALVVGADGTYSRYIFRFSEDLATYALRKIDNVNPSGVNFATLDQGVCVSITENEDIEIFSNDPTRTSVKILKDPNISSDMILTSNATKLTFTRDCEVSSLKMGK